MKENSKGITVSIWVWIVAGVLIAFTVFSVAYFNLYNLSAMTNKQEVKDSFSQLASEINLACTQKGYKNPGIKINTYRARAIYAREGKGLPDPKVPELISKKNKSEGDFLCLSFKEGEFTCKELNCEVELTYMGKPLKGSDMYEIGIEDGSFEFGVSVEKNSAGKVEVDAKHVP